MEWSCESKVMSICLVWAGLVRALADERWRNSTPLYIYVGYMRGEAEDMDSVLRH